MNNPFAENPDFDRRRQESNLAILALLQEQIEEHPYLRFQQILQNLAIVDGKDRSNEEPWDTLARINGESKE
jgi:hypothetical protein